MYRIKWCLSGRGASPKKGKSPKRCIRTSPHTNLIWPCPFTDGWVGAWTSWKLARDFTDDPKQWLHTGKFIRDFVTQRSHPINYTHLIPIHVQAMAMVGSFRLPCIATWVGLPLLVSECP